MGKYKMNWKDLLSTSSQRDRSSKKKIPDIENDNKNNYVHMDLRSDFERDYHRVLSSPSFRRLQDKTQVFPLEKNDFIRTRLTHSIEVSSFGKSLAQSIANEIIKNELDEEFSVSDGISITNILASAGLLHDIGNTPFGHFGEDTIRDWFYNNLEKKEIKDEKGNLKKIGEILNEQMKNDFLFFEGNAQAIRVVSKLHFLVDENGMNLTYALLNTIIKYPVASTKIHPESGDIREKKMGYYYADRELFEDIVSETGAGNHRHPLTFILEAADDIAYKTADIEDAFVKRFLTYHSLRDELRKLQNREKKYADPEEKDQNWFCPADKLVELYDRAKKNGVDDPGDYAVKNWIVKAQGFLIGCATSGFTSHYEEIMEGTYKKDLFAGTLAEGLVKLLGEIACKCVFKTETIYRMEVKEAVMLDNLLDRFVGAAIKYDDPTQKLNSIEERLISFISNNYKKAYRYHAEEKSEVYRLYLRLLLVTDYICGMTDSYAKRLYQELNAIMA